MYIILGVTEKDKKIHHQTFSNYNRAMNFMSYLQSNGVGFIMNKSYPASYPKFIEVLKIIKDNKVNDAIYNTLKTLEEEQNIRAVKILLA